MCAAPAQRHAALRADQPDISCRVMQRGVRIADKGMDEKLVRIPVRQRPGADQAPGGLIQW
jgi:hypothetical protein